MKSLCGVMLTGSLLSYYSQSDGCSSIPSLTVNTSCSNTAFAVNENGTGVAEANASCATAGTAYSDGWFTVTGTGNTITITVSGTNRATALAAFTSCGGGTELDCDIQAAGTDCTISFASTASTTYYIQIQRRAGSTNANLTGDICAVSAASAPSNDDCSNATSLPCATSNLAGTTVSTTSSSDPSGCASDYGVWYTFTGDGNATTISVDADTGFDHELVVFSGSCGSLTNIACVDDDYSGGVETYSFTTTNSVTYYVYIAYYGTSGTSSSTGAFTISRTCTAPITNDDCSGATAFPAIPTDGTCATLSNQSNSGATASGVTPSGACTYNSGTPDDDVWFSFVATTSIVYLEASWVSGSTDVYWQVFEASCSATMTSVLCTDANAGGTMTGLNVGDTYYIRLYNYYSSSTATTQDICLHGPVPGGAGCVGATSISSLPYSQTGFNTSGAGDDFDNSDACGSYYMGGDDFVFEYTPASDECISVTLSNTGSYTGVFITDLCPDDALANCVDYDTDSGGDPYISTVSLNGGTTYYITVSTFPSPQSTMFDIDIENVTCPVPPDNDDCIDATPFPTIPTGGGCAELLNQTNTNATSSGVSPTGACSSNSGTPDDDVWFSFVATETTLYLEATYVSGTSDVYWQVFEASCSGSMTSVLCTDANAGGTMSGLTIGDTYYVRMYCYSSGVSPTYQDLCIHGEPAPVPGQDCTQPLILCSANMTIGNPGYSGTGTTEDFDGSDDCTGGEKNSLWLQINIASTGDLNFDIVPNDCDITNEGAETDYDFLLWRMSGTGATTDCSTITSSASTALEACNYSYVGATGVASGGNAPAGYDAAFDAGYEPTVSATAGDIFYLVIQNYSGSTQGFTVDFSNSGSGVVDYTPPTTIFWTGGIDDVWTDHENWGNCSVTPVCGVDAIVLGTVTNQPIIPTGDIRYVEDLTINNNATLTLSGNAELHVCGDFTNYGNIVFGANSTIIFEGAGNTQNIYGNCTGVNSFGNFIVNKSGGEVVLNCNIEIASDFTTSNGTSVLNTGGYYVTLGGDFNNYDGNTTYSNTGTTGILTFNGTGNQNYDQGASQLDLNDIVMNNTGTGVTLLTSMYSKSVTGSLTLTDGIIVTNGFEVYVQNDAPSAVSDHSVDSYVQGNLRRNIQSLGAYEFPVGESTKGYQNAEVDFIVATSINNLLARFDQYPGLIPTQGGMECSTTYNIENEDNGYWTITADANSSTGKYNVTLYPTNATNTSGASGWTVTKKSSISSGSWGLNGKCVPSSTAAIVMRDSLQGFSVFGAAQSTVPLPETVVSFYGKIEGASNHLYWETASESNSDYFELYRSSDGSSFYKIGEIDAAGHSNNMRYYDLIDYDPFTISYYRLALVSENSDKEFSDIVVLKRDQIIQTVTVHPNPSSSHFNLTINTSYDAKMSYAVYDYTGRIVKEEKIQVVNGSNMFNINLDRNANGVYTLVIFDADNAGMETIKLILQD